MNGQISRPDRVYTFHLDEGACELRVPYALSAESRELFREWISIIMRTIIPSIEPGPGRIAISDGLVELDDDQLEVVRRAERILHESGEVDDEGRSLADHLVEAFDLPAGPVPDLPAYESEQAPER
jgi:hypothetical protein